MKTTGMNNTPITSTPDSAEAVNVRKPVCMHCGENITEPAINFNDSEIWQCADCHHIEWGSWPWGSLLTAPNPLTTKTRTNT